MQRFIEWICSLDQISLSERDRIELQWQDPIEGWLWFVVAVTVGIYVYVIYRHEAGSARARLVMAGLRAAAILLAILLLCQPALVYRRDRVEPSTVAVLVDTSASMARRDHYAHKNWEQLSPLLDEQGDAGSVSRWTLTTAVLQQDDYAMTRRLLQNHDLRLFRFSGSISGAADVTDSAELEPVIRQLAGGEPTGQATHIASALRQAFDACIDAHLTSVVLVTDGQPTQQEDLDHIARLFKSRSTPVFVVPVGSAQPPVDLAIENVRAEKHVYLGDEVAVQFTVRASGMTEGAAIQALIRLAEEGETIDSKILRASGGEYTETVELRFKPQQTGRIRLAVEVPAAEGELELDNNVQQVQVTVVDDKVRVLYVDGYPRYEYRYLKNALLREPSVTSSVLLLSADEAFVQEGSDPVRRFPNSAEELSTYDVVLFGDVDLRSGWITEAQLDLIVEFVRIEGGGFGVIAGDVFTPQQLYGSAIDPLVPAELGTSSGDDFADVQNRAFRAELTPAGRESPILRLQLDPVENARLFNQLPYLYWCYAIQAPKPGAEVLLEHPQLQHNGKHLPLLIVGRHGAGLTLYQGTDDTWRWRRHRGEPLFDTYWLQVMRYLARNKKFHTSTPFTLTTNKSEYEPAEPVVITLSFDAPLGSGQLPDTVLVDVRTARGIIVEQVSLSRLTANSRLYQGGLLTSAGGQHEVIFSPQRYGLEHPDQHALFEVLQRSLENAVPEANIQLMSELADTTGGQLVQTWEAAAVADVIPQRKYIVPDDVVETIWDSKLGLIVFVILIGAEWILRKAKGLA